jgi:large conductance mechanosensitive channel
MGFVKEFKEFVSRGNVVDLAVGIVIGGAFGKIVSSFVQDILMPPVGLMIGGVDFKFIQLTLKQAIVDSSGKLVTPAVTLNIGNFLQSVFDFLIIAFAVFLFIKAINRLKRRQVQEDLLNAPPAAPSKEQVLLTEIRDILKQRPL